MMMHRIISSIGLGILGVDPFTAVYLLSMGLRKEKKSNIALFFLSYAGFSVLTGAVLSALFGAAAVDLLKSMVPGDDSPFWAILEFAVSVFILVWVLRKIFRVGKKKEKAGKKAVGGSRIRCLSVGIMFAISCFTDEILLSLGGMYAGGGDFTANIDKVGGEGTAVFAHRAIEELVESKKK